MANAAEKRDPEWSLSGEINLRKEQIDLGPGLAERRAKPRIRQPFRATVDGIDTNSKAFQLSTELENMSSSGLYLRMPRQVNVGDDLKFVISFSNGSKTGATASVLGRVLRIEPGADGLNGFGLAIVRYEFV